MKVVLCVETNWNFLCGLLYAEHVCATEVVVFKGSGVTLHRYFKVVSERRRYTFFDILDGSGVSKMLSIKKMASACKKIGKVDVSVRMSNFSPIIRILSKNIDSNKVVFLDEGLLLYNAYHASQKYNMDSIKKKIAYKILFNYSARFDFLDFEDVDESYLAFSQVWKSKYDLSDDTEVFDFKSVVDLVKLKLLVEKLFDLDGQIEQWGKLLSATSTVILGGAFVSHGLMTKEEYSDILISQFESSKGIIYKRHPAENLEEISKLGNVFLFPHSDIPIEVFFSFHLPKSIKGFGSASQFFIDEQGLECRNLVMLPKSVFGEEFFTDLRQYVSKETTLLRV